MDREGRERVLGSPRFPRDYQVRERPPREEGLGEDRRVRDRANSGPSYAYDRLRSRDEYDRRRRPSRRFDDGKPLGNATSSRRDAPRDKEARAVRSGDRITYSMRDETRAARRASRSGSSLDQLPQQAKASREVSTRDVRGRYRGKIGHADARKRIWSGSRRSSIFDFAKRAVVVIIAVLLIAFIATRIAGCVRGSGADDGNAASSQTESKQAVTYTPSIASIGAIPSTGEVVSPFSLINGTDEESLPSLSERDAKLIDAALAHYAPNDRTVGFVFIDLQSGRGYAYNADAMVYGASAIKAPVVLFACMQAEAEALTHASFKDYAEESIAWSDNDAYRSLCDVADIGGEGTVFGDWLDDLGIDVNLLSTRDFPSFSTRDLVKFWMSIYIYLEQGNEELTQWLRGQLSSTDVSMVRDAVGGVSALDTSSFLTQGAALATVGVARCLMTSVEGVGEGARDTRHDADAGGAQGSVEDAGGAQGSVEDAAAADARITVYNKAGWIADGDLNAINDAAIVLEDDNPYLFCIMTDVPDCDENRLLVTNLAKALWGTRSSLRA